MRAPWFNAENPHFNHDDFQVSPGHTPLQSFLITVFTIILFPIMLVLYPIGKLIWGAFMIAGHIGFYLGEYVTAKKHDPDTRYDFQWLRAWFSKQAGNLPHINTGFRKFLYRLSGLHVGKGGFIGMGGIFEDLNPENVVIEDNVTISFGVTIVGHGPKRALKKSEDKMVILRSHAYVGARALLIPGVEVGSHATVGAGAVVTKDVPPGAVVAGSPARILYYKPGYEPAETVEKNS